MASAVDSRLAYARLSAVATASRLPTATRGSNNSYTTSWDTTDFCLIFVPFGHYDEPEILRYAITSICPKGADVRHPPLLIRT